jgi:CHAT domain-containing protein
MVTSRRVFVLLLVLPCLMAMAAPARAGFETDLAEAIALRDDGHYLLARKHLEQLQTAPQQSTYQRQVLRIELGIAANRMLDHKGAIATLEPMLQEGPSDLRARAAIEVAIARIALGQTPQAQLLLDELAKGSGSEAAQAALIRLQLEPASVRGSGLRAWWQAGTQLAPEAQASLALAALRMAIDLPDAADLVEPFRVAAEGNPAVGRGRHTIDLAELQSALAERSGDAPAALALTKAALARASISRAAIDDLRYKLEWRLARLARSTGNDDAALAALQRAVSILERLRIDLPISYPDGQSSHSATLQPVYSALVDLLLKRAALRQGEARQRDLLAARRIAELLKQSEMQDYLGERCAIAGADTIILDEPPAGTALLYPLILPDRTEVLLQTPGGVERKIIAMTADNVRLIVQRYASALRARDDDFLATGKALHGLLLGDWADTLAASGIHTIAVVPDGSLRVLPWAALHDGNRYLGERFAIATLSGLAIRPRSGSGRRGTLITGLAVPGDVVNRLADMEALNGILPESANVSRGLGETRTRSLVTPPSQPDAASLALLRQQLTLPGVRDEVTNLASRLSARTLLDADFSKLGLGREIAKSDYATVHIATHGFFGKSGAESFLMAHDDLITMNDLEALLKQDSTRKRPVELLTLSACETAEGDERSPLGIAGVAIKAKASSVVGTLWPVSDAAARRLMEAFYEGLLAGETRANALRRSQAILIADPEMSHPFFWAPFIVIGNWM